MPTLLDLPVELTQEITTYLILRDARSFRLSCKDVESKSLRTFVDKFVHTITIHLLRSSLQSLVELSRNSKMRAHIRKMVIQYEENAVIAAMETCEFLYGEPLSVGQSAIARDTWESHLEGYRPFIPPHSVLQGERRFGPGEEVQLTAEMIETYRTLMQEKDENVKTNLDSSMLAEALANLPSIDCIEIADRGDSYFTPDMYEFTEALQGSEDVINHSVNAVRHCPDCWKNYFYRECVHRHPLTILSTLFAKLHRPLNLTKLALDFKLLNTREISRVASVPGLFLHNTEFAQAFHGLQKLDLRLDYDAHGHYYGLADFLQHCGNLKELRVGKAQCSSRPPTIQILFAIGQAGINLSSLQHITLQDFSFWSILEFKSLCWTFAKQLKTLTLRDNSMDGGWSAAFVQISQMQSLECVYVHNLSAKWNPFPPQAISLFADAATVWLDERIVGFEGALPYATRHEAHLVRILQRANKRIEWGGDLAPV